MRPKAGIVVGRSYVDALESPDKPEWASSGFDLRVGIALGFARVPLVGSLDRRMVSMAAIVKTVVVLVIEAVICWFWARPDQT
jgi:hypothetical protein